MARAAQAAVKVALVAKEDLLDPARFGMTVARNRGSLHELVLVRTRGIALAARSEGGMKRVADELVASEQRYRLLFERNPLPMWVYDRETLRFLAVNEAAVRHFGYSRDEFHGMTVVDIRPEEERARLAGGGA